MTERKSDFTLPTNMLDDLFSTQEERDDAKLSKIRDIPLIEIDDFPEHPFKVRDDEDYLQELQKNYMKKMTEIFFHSLCWNTYRTEILCSRSTIF